MTVGLINRYGWNILDGQEVLIKNVFYHFESVKSKNIPFVIASGNGMGRLLQLCKGIWKTD